MREFSLASAWASGLRFFSGAALNHAILLIGVGVLLPVSLQVLLLGQPTAMLSAAGPAASEAVDTRLAGPLFLIGFWLQTGSFFASWRLGFARGATLRGALLFGILAGLMVCIGFFVLVIGISALFGLIAVPVGALALLVAFVALFGLAWTSFAALFAVGVCLFFVLALVFGTAMGDVTYAATLVGGGGYVWTILVAGAFVLLWLAARFSCTAVLMAEAGSYNLVRAMRESWSLTWDDEWRITRYLGLIGLATALLSIGDLAAAGATRGAAVAAGGNATGMIVPTLLLILLWIPLSYLSVLVPAGIYRELVPADVATAEVFA